MEEQASIGREERELVHEDEGEEEEEDEGGEEGAVGDHGGCRQPYAFARFRSFARRTVSEGRLLAAEVRSSGRSREGVAPRDGPPKARGWVHPRSRPREAARAASRGELPNS